MEDLSRLVTLTDEIEGFLGKREGPYLFRLAKMGASLGAIVEIGSWKGRSTIWLARGSEAVNGHLVYAIDPHTGSPEHNQGGKIAVSTEREFSLNIKRADVQSRVVAKIKTSMQALSEWQEPIGLLWIDGDHSYEAVSQDFLGWVPHVVDKGIIALHDTYSWEGVRRLVDQQILRSSEFRVLGQLDGILALQKTRSLTKADLIKKDFTSYFRRVYNQARVGRKHWRALPRKILRALAVP